MTNLAQTNSKNYELAADILATFSILEKHGFDEITGNTTNFCAFINELGFRTVTGKEFDSANLIKIFRNYITPKEKERLIEEFSASFNYAHVLQEIVAPKIIH